MSVANQEFLLHFAEKAGDIFLDATSSDVLMVLSDTPVSGAILAGFATSGGSSLPSMIRMDMSNLSVNGCLSATSLAGPSFSNINSVMYANITCNAGNLCLGGDFLAQGFCNVSGITYATTLSNAGGFSVGGAMSVASNLSVLGTLTVQKLVYTQPNPNLIVNGWFSNAGDATIGGSLTVGSNILTSGFSNINGMTYTTTLSNAGDIFVGGTTALMGTALLAPGFSNVGGVTYITTLSNAGAVVVGGLLTAVSDIHAFGFSNIGGATFTRTLSNAGNASVNGAMTIGSDLTVGGTLTVQKVEYAYSNVTIFSSETINSNLSVNGWLSNIGDASIGGSLVVGSNLVAQSGILGTGFSNVQGVTYTSALQNAGDLHIIGNLTASSLGVGLLDPKYQVDVAGDIRASGNLIASGFKIVRNGNYSGSSASGNQGSGSSQLPSGWVASNGTAFIVGSNVGVGTSAPSYPLDVVGGTRLLGGVYAEGFSNVAGVTYASNVVACLVTLHGSDYAEYMLKANPLSDFDPGSVVGVDSCGYLTTSFKDSVQYGIKTSSPCIVGGDEWSAALGSRESYPEGELQWDTDYACARSTVDRIAYCGRLPVEVYGSLPGDYIVPMDGGSDTIIGVTVKADTITFQQFKTAIGRVMSVAEDGRAIVKVMCG